MVSSSRRPFRPFSHEQPPPPPPPAEKDLPPLPPPAAADPSRVFNRLHALFGPSDPSSSSPSTSASHYQGQLVSRCRTEPAMGSSPSTEGSSTAPPVKERDAIKVLCVTWNMGDALPKGDLSVLLGNIPAYTPADPTDGLPQLPVEDAHPYHIVVVAGQECPTPSGVPRGLGGVIKGVSVRVGPHKKDKDKEKDKDKDKDDKPIKEHLDVLSDPPLAPGQRSPLLDGSSSDEETPHASRTASPAPNSPHSPMMHKHAGAGKGWSTMLDDWFCGPPVIKQDSLPLATGQVATSPRDVSSSLLSPISRIPDMVRSASAPATPVAASPLLIPSDPTSPRRGGHGPTLVRSPLARSQSSQDSSSTEPEYEQGGHFRNLPDIVGEDRPKAVSMPSEATERPQIVIPAAEGEMAKTSGGRQGCYLHLVKERLMGMYLSVYVYKGCEHLVQGVDKDFVTAGLVRGRLGNKGGIGISVKIADHTFLFVNSHLAAHTSRMGTRIANVRKIKEELRLDCFLPKDDPRAQAEDITDRFDSVFWMGDLNFRLELSRLHAEWLIEQKNYAEALMWDQLRSIMKDPDSNPFPGFQEHPIDFAPTFKYDVWRSVKATNREIRRSLRRRATLEGKGRPPKTDLQDGSLPHVPEDDAPEEQPPSGEEPSEVAADGQRDSEEDTRVEDEETSRRSFESSRYTSDARSMTGTDIDEDEEVVGQSIDYTAYGSRHRALEVAIKKKTKRILGLVKMDGILTPNKKAGPDGTNRKVSQRRLTTKKSMDFDEQSRRTSMSSYRSMVDDEREQTASLSSSMPAAPITPNELIPPPSNVRRQSLSAGSPRTGGGAPLTRGMSVLKRTMSGRSVKMDGASENADSLEGIGEGEEENDPREGVYDSSKKQRVPSWCDRVLWKSHIVPDPDPVLSPTTSNEPTSTPAPHHRLSRLPHYFAHLRTSIARSASLEPSLNDRRLGEPLPISSAHAHGIIIPSSRSSSVSTSANTPTLIASPEGSPDLPASSPPGLVPAPKRPSPRRPRSAGTASSPHPLTDPTSEQHASPANPMITFDPATSFGADRGGRSGRKRANSDSVKAVDLPDGEPGSSAAARRGGETSASTKSPSIPTLLPRRENSTGSMHHRHSPRRAALPMHHAPTLPAFAVSRAISSGSGAGGADDDRSGFVRFFRELRELPNWLHVGRTGSTNVPSSAEDTRRDKDRDVVQPRRRRQKGEVVCLHYGTIDDAGMRQLEGRSDHRPAIFAAAVYI